MKRVRYIVLLMVCALALTTSEVCVNKVTAQPVAAPAVTTEQCQSVQPLAVVANPRAYLDKTITMSAKFDKFSTLGLDYKPAFKSSDDYISFLIKRDDSTYDIPLSEMKLFIKREEAEKFIDLKTNDEISITGKVFSDALGDAWVDVSKLTLVKKAPEKDGVK
ncbi:MAG: hypothetical protein NC408_02850 [Candidatus Gastranaerophilales bacterium]|nr:hypothetical protein [Candidatus Gastranaerophilales bacterium]MCM1073928.1 hypothetical protein [Bacteroides sp.]